MITAKFRGMRYGHIGRLADRVRSSQRGSINDLGELRHTGIMTLATDASAVRNSGPKLSGAGLLGADQPNRRFTTYMHAACKMSGGLGAT
jgi:hypothetical protein